MDSDPLEFQFDEGHDWSSGNPCFVRFLIRLPFQLPLTPGILHVFDPGVGYADEAALEALATQPVVLATIHQIQKSNEDLPPIVRPGFVEGIDLIWGEGRDGNDLSSQLPAAGTPDDLFVDTWVELETPIALLSGEPEDGYLPTVCFERCIKQLNWLIRATAVVTDDEQIHPVNKEALDPVIPMSVVRVGENEEIARGLMVLHYRFEWLPIEPLPDAKEHQVYAFVRMHANDHPFTSYQHGCGAHTDHATNRETTSRPSSSFKLQSRAWHTGCFAAFSWTTGEPRPRSKQNLLTYPVSPR